MNHNRRLTHILSYIAIAAVMAATATSCGTSRPATASRYEGSASKSKSDKGQGRDKNGRDDIAVDRTMAEPTRRLLDEARAWLGVPYLWGGNDKKGVDCSGFVAGVYLKALEIKLPRNSARQSEFVTPVRKENMHPGDLVFFDTSSNRAGKVTHVGMYIGNGEMVHSSSSRGVIVSRIDSNYYAERLLSAGRVDQYYAKLNAKDADKRQNNPEMPRRQEKQPVRETPEPVFQARVDKADSPDTPRQTAPRTKTAKDAKDKKDTKIKREKESARTKKDKTAVSAEEARKAVLNSLIEEKIDSIYAVSMK